MGPPPGVPAPVPVVEVNTANWTELRPLVLKAVETASYVAVDLELSGIGASRDLGLPDVEQRYQKLVHVADTRAVISLGLSCVRLLTSHPAVGGDGTGNGNSWTFLAQNFDVLCACQDEYVTDPRSVKFLVDHGFDFNRQMALGMPYRRGRPLTNNNNRKAAEADAEPEVRDVVLQLIRRKVPIVCHNGLVDVVFLYRHFVSPALPPTLRHLAVDLHHLFSLGGGIYDTKYVSEFVARMSVTYLVYLFRKFAETNEDKRRRGKNHVAVVFPPYPKGWAHLDLMDEDEDGDEENGEKGGGEGQVDVCESYALHGCCRNDSCSKSHNIDDVLLWEKSGSGDGGSKSTAKRRRERKRKANGAAVSAMNVEAKEEDKEEEKTAVENGSRSVDAEDVKPSQTTTTTKTTTRGGGSGRREAHRAGYDAFMTGHLFAAMASTFAKPQLPLNPASFRPSDAGLTHCANRIFLSGKKTPLLLDDSAFDRPSPCVAEIKRVLGLTS